MTYLSDESLSKSFSVAVVLLKKISGTSQWTVVIHHATSDMKYTRPQAYGHHHFVAANCFTNESIQS